MSGGILIKMLVIVCYFAGLFFIGVLASRKIKDMEDFFVGGKKLNFWLVSFSSRATGESGWLLLGLTGMGFAVGIQALWIVLGEVIGVTICWVFMTQRFKSLSDRYDSVTVTDYLVDRVKDTSHILRVLATLVLVIFITSYVSAQFAACGKAFKGFLGIPHMWGVVIGMVIVAFYTVAGGFVAVVWSDLVQGLLMLFGLIMVPIVGIYYAGGWEPMIAKAHAANPALLSIWGSHGFGWAGILTTAGFLAVGFGYLGSPQLFVRFMAVKDRQELNKGALVAVAFTILADTGAVLAGMTGHALIAPGGPLAKHSLFLLKDSEQILPLLANNLFPVLIAGFLIAVVLAAIMSTADSLLVLVSSAVVRDTVQKIFRPDMDAETLTKMSRWVTFALCLLALVPALNGNAVIFWFVLFAWTGITTCFCPILILSLFWKGLTRWGSIAGMLTGLFLTIFWKLAPLSWLPSLSNWAQSTKVLTAQAAEKAKLHAVIDHMIVAFFGALFMAIVVSLLTKAPEEAKADMKATQAEVVDLWSSK